MLSEYRPEIDEIFGDLVPTFSTPEQLNDLIHYWLPKTWERKEIGAHLEKIAKKHTYVERAKTIIKVLDGLL